VTTNFNTSQNHLQDSDRLHATQPGGVVQLFANPATGEVTRQAIGEDCPRAREEHGQPGTELFRGSLVLYVGIASFSRETHETGHFERVSRRFALQDVARVLLPGESVCKCLRARFSAGQGVGVHFSHEVKKAHYSNLITCGLSWVDPVCAAKISERRRVELAQAVDIHKARGGSMLLVTLTMRHGAGDDLGWLLKDMSTAYRALKSGRFWQEFAKQYGIVGCVSALEITYSLESGFHPHRHVLFFCSGEITEYEEVVIDWELSERWQKMLGKRGRFASWGAGVDVQRGYGAVGDYVTKWGLVEEVTKSNSKVGRVDEQTGHYSPFELLDLVRSGSPWAGPVFVDYAHATKGLHPLVWSAGLRDRFDLGAELSDLELAEQQTEKAVLLLTLLYPDWKVILKQRARATLLEVAATGKKELVLAYLSGLGINLEDA
jgi:hypothetical protein